MEPRRPAIFLDRDGVINENRPDHVKRWDEFSFLPGVFDALRELAGEGRPLIVVTNQGAIGRGLTSSEAVEQIHSRMCEEVSRHGGRIDGSYYCPHRPEEGCDCRKPQPGLLIRAARERRLDLANSFFIGDAVSDVEAALAAGCRPILILTGRGAEQALVLGQRGFSNVPVVTDLFAALEVIRRAEFCPDEVRGQALG